MGAIDLARRGDDAVGVGASPSHLAADGRTLWVTNADGHSVSRIDLDDHTVRQTVPVGNGPAGMAVAADAMWVANSRDGTVSRIDATTNTVVDRITVGNKPDERGGRRRRGLGRELRRSHDLEDRPSKRAGDHDRSAGRADRAAPSEPARCG